MSNIGYVRVSTVQQNNERQLEGVELDRIFEDTASGKNQDRQGLKAMLDFVREGDTVHVHEISRLGRNTADLLGIVEELKNKGCIVMFHKEGITVSRETRHSTGNMMLTVLAAVAQMERELMLERQAEGYEAAKAAGRIPGRGASKSIDRAGIKLALETKSIRAVAEEFGISTQTVQRIKKEG